MHGLFGAPKPGYRVGPEWAGRISHPLIIVSGATLAAALWFTRGRSPRRPLPALDALLALALVLLLRSVLDTWDAVYYPLPFVLALLAWEVARCPSRPPALALCTTVLVWVSFQWLPQHASADQQAAFFLAWSLPLAAGLGAALFRAAPAARARDAGPPDYGGAQEMTVSSLGRLVRTS